MKTPKAIEVIQQYQEYLEKPGIQDGVVYMDELPNIAELDKALSKAVEVMGRETRIAIRDTPLPTMTNEEMINDYPRLKRQYTLLHQEYRHLRGK